MSLVLHESAEMYLETIYVMQQETTRVRAVDIASRMGYSKPTISEWVNKLKDAGYIEPDSRHGITLTPEGEKVAEKVYDRHVTLTKLFVQLGVNPDIAQEDACRVEHYISDETFNALKSHLLKHSDNEFVPAASDFEPATA